MISCLICLPYCNALVVCNDAPKLCDALFEISGLEKFMLLQQSRSDKYELDVLQFQCVSQTLFGNPKGPVEQGNPNTCAETKLCLILFYSGSRSSLL